MIIKHRGPRPIRATEGSSGLDLKASESVTILKKGRALVKTGLFLEIPKGLEGQIRPRSGLALKHGITVLNSPGTIDSDYRGEVGIILINLSNMDYKIEKGDKIAQMVITSVETGDTLKWQETETFQETIRGEGGYGSTGK